MKSTKWLKSKPPRSLYIDKEKGRGLGFYVNIETEKWSVFFRWNCALKVSD